MEEGPGKQKRKQMEEGIRWKRELERHRKGEREEERVSEREKDTQREKLSAVYRQGILRRETSYKGIWKKKRNESEKGPWKKEKKSTRCLYCIDLKLAVVKKRRKRKREGGLASSMREQVISCVSMIVIAHPGPGTDISQRAACIGVSGWQSVQRPVRGPGVRITQTYHWLDQND